MMAVSIDKGDEIAGLGNVQLVFPGADEPSALLYGGVIRRLMGEEYDRAVFRPERQVVYEPVSDIAIGLGRLLVAPRHRKNDEVNAAGIE